MTTTPEPKDFQSEVLERLEQRLDSNVQRLEQKLDTNIQRLDERTDKWEEPSSNYPKTTWLSHEL